MPTLILSPRYTPDSQALWKAALHAGWNVERLQTHAPPLWLRDQHPVLYGEGIFVRIIADALGIELIEPPFPWLTYLPEKYLQRWVTFTTLAEAKRYTEPAFIKPAGDKSFDAKVYISSAELPSTDELPDSTPVLIAEPVSWEIEFRCFVLNSKPITISPYSKHGEFWLPETENEPALSNQIDEALNYCRMLLHDPAVQIPPAFALDIGVIRDKGWAVVEANPAWASGIYGCDPVKILSVLETACVVREQG